MSEADRNGNLPLGTGLAIGIAAGHVLPVTNPTIRLWIGMAVGLVLGTVLSQL